MPDTGDANTGMVYQGNESERLDGSSSVEAKKLTEWINEPNVEDLKRDLESARSSHDLHVAKVDVWTGLMRGERHRHHGDKKNVYGYDNEDRKGPEMRKGRSKVQPKLIRRVSEWRYAALSEPFLGSNKVFKVDPATAADGNAATQNELVLNWQFRTKLNRVKFIDDYVRSTVDEGTCIVKVGWQRQVVEAEKDVPVWTHTVMDQNDQNPQTEQNAQALQAAIIRKQQDPKGYENETDPALKAAVDYHEETKIPTVAKQTGTQTIKYDKVLENFPTVKMIDPRNIYIDASCDGEFSKALFTIESFETSQSDLLKEPNRYHNLHMVDWSNNTPAAEPNHHTLTPAESGMIDPMRRRVVAYEYWGLYDMNKDGTLVPFVATWIGSTLIRMEENPYPDQKIPYILVPYMPKKRQLMGEPDAELLEDHQSILGAVTRGTIDLLGRSANGQQGIAKGMLDALNRRRYENGEDYEYNPGQNPDQGITQHKYPELPQSALTMIEMTNQEAEALTGVKSFSGGISGTAYGPVAGNAKSALDAAAKREMSILRRLAQGMVEIGTKIIAMNSEFLSEKETINVTNTLFVEISREDLKGNFDLIVDISTAEVDEQKSQDLAFMLQTCGPTVGPDILMSIMADIAELKRMPVLAQRLRTYKPPPPPPPSPEQQQMTQLQLQAAQLTIQKLQAEIQLMQAKSDMETSKKDLSNLDYVEQETGTKHAREMQLAAMNESGQHNVAITKALLTPTKPEESKPDIHAAIGFKHLTDKTSMASL